MTTEELLKPRIKVIAPAPIMINKVGEFLSRFDHTDDFDFGIKTNMAEYFYSMKEFKEWPYIFKICKWWEERTVDIMPKYVKTTYDGTINEVHSYDFKTNTIYAIYPEGKCPYSLNAYLSARVPATEQEYNDYKKSK